MNCRQIKRNLAFYLESTLPTEQQVEIERHLRDCPTCFHLTEEFSRLWRISKRVAKIQPDPFFWVKLRQRIGRYEEGGNPLKGWIEVIARRARPAIIVAAVLLCIFLGYSLGNVPPSVNGQTTSPEKVRIFALQNFFENNYFNPLNGLPTGSLEATYWNMISQK